MRDILIYDDQWKMLPNIWAYRAQLSTTTPSKRNCHMPRQFSSRRPITIVIAYRRAGIMDFARPTLGITELNNAYVPVQNAADVGSGPKPAVIRCPASGRRIRAEGSLSQLLGQRDFSNLLLREHHKMIPSVAAVERTAVLTGRQFSRIRFFFS